MTAQDDPLEPLCSCDRDPSEPAPDYSVVIPVYGSRESIPDLVEQLKALDWVLGGKMEVLFVVDGSPDDSDVILQQELCKPVLRATVVSRSRNYGSFSAIRMGSRYVRGRLVAVLSADLQEPHELLPDFFGALESGDSDIAIGRRVGRDDPLTSSVASRAYWGFYRRLINRDIPSGGVDVFACSAEVARNLADFTEVRTGLTGLLFWVGYRRTYVDYRRQSQHSGKSGWTFGGKVSYLADSVYAFTDLPVRILQIVGLLGVVTSIIVGLVFFAAWAFGQILVPGYAPTMIVLLAATSAVLMAFGVVGSYVWRAYENGESRPLALVKSVETFSRGHS